MDTREQVELVTTRVHFLPLTPPTSPGMSARGEPSGKAGAYAIQGHAARFIDWIDGSWSNVVGLPLATVNRMLEDAGVRRLTGAGLAEYSDGWGLPVNPYEI